MKTMFKNPPQFKRITPILVDDFIRRHYVYLFPNGYILYVVWDNTSEPGCAIIRIQHYDSTFGEYLSIDARSYIPLAGYADTCVRTKRQLLHWLNFVYGLPSDKHFSKRFLSQMRREKRLDEYEGAFNKFPKIKVIETIDLGKIFTEEEIIRMSRGPINLPIASTLEEFNKKFHIPPHLDQDGAYGKQVRAKDFIAHVLSGQQ